MRGPPPTPTPVLKARGSKRAKARAGEVEYAPGVAPPPGWLSAEAAAEWARVAPELERAGVLQVVDWAVFAAYCEAWSEFVALTKLAKAVEAAEAVASGVAGQRRKAAAELSRLAQQFGFTPASRPRVQGGDRPKSVADAREGKFFGR